MKTVFLASKILINYDHATDGDHMLGVTVTKQCYNALKANGYLPSADERQKLADAWSFNGFWVNPHYGGTDGFTYKELRKFLGSSVLTAAQVRAL